MTKREVKDRILLKELIDRVSILGDRKDFRAQLMLFTEDAISDTFAGGKEILKLRGRVEMERAFERFLSKFDTVYHFNGQQVVEIDGDFARGTCYCLVTLVGIEEDKTMKTTIGAIYQDEYKREKNHWLISKRIGNFSWQEKLEV